MAVLFKLSALVSDSNKYLPVRRFRSNAASKICSTALDLGVDLPF